MRWFSSLRRRWASPTDRPTGIVDIGEESKIAPAWEYCVLGNEAMKLGNEVAIWILLIDVRSEQVCCCCVSNFHFLNTFKYTPSTIDIFDEKISGAYIAKPANARVFSKIIRGSIPDRFKEIAKWTFWFFFVNPESILKKLQLNFKENSVVCPSPNVSL